MIAESDSSRLANALLRLDDALDNLSAYFKGEEYNFEDLVM